LKIFLQLISGVSISIFLIFFLRKHAKFIKLIDNPCARKKHTGNIPTIGGISIYFSVIFSSFFITNSITEIHYLLLFFLPVFIISLIDDIKPQNWIVRIAFQFFSAFLVVRFLGYEITTLDNIIFFEKIDLGVFSQLFSILLIMFMVNAFNFIDGHDGLSSSFFIFALIFLTINNLHIEYFTNLILSPLIATLVFLYFNLSNRYKIFLGDSGSSLLGFLFGCLIITAHNDFDLGISSSFTLFLAPIPVLDLISVLVLRLYYGKSLFQADRLHVHLIMKDLGFLNFQILLFLLIINFLIFAIIMQFKSFTHISYAFIIIQVIYIITLIKLSKKVTVYEKGN